MRTNAGAGEGGEEGNRNVGHGHLDCSSFNLFVPSGLA